MLVIMASPSISPENLRVQRNSTRRAFLIFRAGSALMTSGFSSSMGDPVSGDDTPGHGYGAQAPPAA